MGIVNTFRTRKTSFFPKTLDMEWEDTDTRRPHRVEPVIGKGLDSNTI